MRLVTVQVENFKSIENSEQFTIDQITCLVGKNEAGKSATLQALYKLNPEDQQHRFFDLVEEYPRRFLPDYQRLERSDPKTPKPNVLTTAWELDANDIEYVENVIGKDAIVKPKGDKHTKVTITKGYDNKRIWTIPLNEKKITERFLSEAQLSKDELDQLKDVSTVELLIEQLDEVTTRSERQEELLKILNTSFPKGTASDAALKLLDERLPKFVYFANYHTLPGRVSIENLRTNIANKETQPLDFKDRIFLALLTLAGARMDDIAKAGRPAYRGGKRG